MADFTLCDVKWGLHSYFSCLLMLYMNFLQAFWVFGFCFFAPQPILSNLETLNLGQNNLGNDGVHILKDALMKNRSLLRLGLYACRFGDQGKRQSYTVHFKPVKGPTRCCCKRQGQFFLCKKAWK